MSPDFFNNVEIHLYDPSHLGFPLPKDSPQGILKVHRLHRKIEYLVEHAKKSMQSSINAIKS